MRLGLKQKTRTANVTRSWISWLNPNFKLYTYTHFNDSSSYCTHMHIMFIKSQLQFLARSLHYYLCLAVLISLYNKAHIYIVHDPFEHALACLCMDTLFCYTFILLDIEEDKENKRKGMWNMILIEEYPCSIYIPLLRNDELKFHNLYLNSSTRMVETQCSSLWHVMLHIDIENDIKHPNLMQMRPN